WLSGHAPIQIPGRPNIDTEVGYGLGNDPNSRRWIKIGHHNVINADAMEKVVHSNYYTASPYELFIEVIRQYHNDGLRFFLSWRESETRRQPEPLFWDVGECVTGGAYFGQLFTDFSLITRKESL